MFKQFIIAIAIFFLLTTGAGEALAQQCDYFNSNSFEPNFTQGTSPREAALIIFNRNTGDLEGRKSEGFTIDYQFLGTEIKAFLSEELVGLADDSVAGIRYCLGFVSYDFNNWKLDWAGQQVKCLPGRGHEDWGTERCG
ncbi:MAG: hypothetical protein F6K31_06250 [Symploca sp. SIO2G7]|nr:hypothetical protein [Symploca sp. SIO2G7]